MSVREPANPRVLALDYRVANNDDVIYRTASSLQRPATLILSVDRGFLTENDMVSVGYDIHAFLRVSQVCEDRLNSFLREVCDVRSSAIWNNLHLTIYQGRLRLPGLHEQTRRVQIGASTDEMRFMVLKPGGINPQPGINPRQHAIGIRLTRRNKAMQWINELRQEMIEYERRRDIIGRKGSTLKHNAFGPKEYVPHVKLLNRDNRISLALPHIREQLKHNIETIEFTHFEVRVNAN